MLNNNGNIQTRRDGQSKSRIARLLVLTGILGATGLHAQYFELSTATPPANALSQPNADGADGPYLLDDEAFHGQDLLNTGKMLVTAYQASGAGGSVTTLEYYSNTLNCAAAWVKTIYSWTFSPDVTSVPANQKVTLAFNIIQAPSCHVHNGVNGYPGQFASMSVVQYGGLMDSNSWGAYVLSPPAGTANPNVRTLTAEPSGLPAAEFHIQLGSDDSIDVVYPYKQVSTAPQTEIAHWVSTQPGFGAEIPSTFVSYPNGLAYLGVPATGWALYSLSFEYEGGRTVVVWMTYQKSNPNSLFMAYLDPTTEKYVGWVAYN